MQLSPPAEVHHRLVMRGCRFWVEGDALVVEPASLLEPTDVASLKTHKAEIHRRLSESSRQRKETRTPACEFGTHLPRSSLRAADHDSGTHSPSPLASDRI